MHTAIPIAANGPGMFPFRHRNYDQDTPAWDLHQRAILLGYEITGRDDSDTSTSVGAWKEDQDTRGDLNCANYWQSDYDQRKVGCWGFGYPSVVEKAQDDPNGTTGNSLYGNSDTTTTGPSQMKVKPIGQNAQKDDRFKPKMPFHIQPEDIADDDPNGPNANGDNANGNGGADPNGGDPNGIVNLGGGWQYQDGVIVYNGPSANSVDSLSGFNGGYFGGGFSTFTFGGSNSTSALTGIPGIGFHSGFAGFSGVRNFFGGGRSIGFSFSGGSP